jgi:hypothetical protein
MQRPREAFTYVTAVYAGDMLIVAGTTRSVRAFADLT